MTDEGATEPARIPTSAIGLTIGTCLPDVAGVTRK